MTSRPPDRAALLIIAAALVAGVGGYLLSRVLFPAAPGSAPATIPAAIAVGDPVPHLVLPDLAGRSRPLAEWSGRPVLVNFWATWCGPCVQEMPLLAQVRRDRASIKLEVVGIALDDPVAVHEFVLTHGIDYPILLDKPGAADSSVRLGNHRGVLPYSVLISPDGTLLATHTGDFQDTHELAAFLATLP